jgi:protocatechuate 3,4-dioxygenase beta subunit
VSESDQTQKEQHTTSKPRSKRVWAAVLCLGLGVLAYKAIPSRDAKPSAGSAPAEEAPDGPLLAISVWADGEPLGDAKVALHGARCQERERTDGDGLVKTHACTAGPVAVSVEVPDYIRVERSILLSESGSLERIDLEPGERLAGRIVDDSGRPLPGITLTARMLGPSAARAPSTPWLTLTGSDGSFSIETMPAGQVVLDISDGGAHEPTSVTDLSLPTQAVLITLRRTAAMSGKVLGADGTAVPDARVTLAGSGVWPARVLQTDPAGDFLFANVPEGVYELRAEQGNTVSAPLEGVSVQPGSHAKIDLVLAPGVILRGRVRAAASGAALRAEVRVVEEALSGHERTVQSQADGSFEVQGLRMLPHRVTLQSPGYVAEQRWLTPGSNAVIELLRGAAVSGKIVDSDGRPVAHADIEVKGRSVTGQSVQMVGPIQEAPPLADSSTRAVAGGDNLGVTSGNVPRVPVMPAGTLSGASGELGFHSDERGSFYIDGLPPGQFTLSARKPGMSVGRSSQLQLKAGGTLPDIVITLPAGVSLRGRVVDAHGDNVARVRVDLVSGSDLPRSTTTSASGEFVFESARGDCTLWARPFGAPAAKLSGNAQELAARDLLITLESNTDRVRGRVSDANGQPIEAASVRLEAIKSHGYAPTVLSGADGTFEFAALPPPPYALSVEHPDYSPARKQTIEYTRDVVDVRLQRGAAVRGSVTDAVSRLPLAAAEVVVRSAGVARAARTAKDGTFELEHVPEGPFQVSVTADGYVSTTEDGQLSPPAVQLRLELTHAASISGEIVDSLGRTVWNAQVTFGASPDWSRSARSDHAGRFRLQGVPEGDHWLHARHGTLQATSAAPVRVVEGEDTPGAVVRLPGVVDEEAADDAQQARTAVPRGGPVDFGMRGSRVVIEHVAEGSAAEQAGLQEGDVLISVDGEPARSAAQARGMMNRSRRGTHSLQVRRDQQVLELSYGGR